MRCSVGQQKWCLAKWRGDDGEIKFKVKVQIEEGKSEEEESLDEDSDEEESGEEGDMSVDVEN